MFKNLYAPWRENYTKSNCDIACPFCRRFQENNDIDNFILKRFETCVVMLNLYPYNPGHLLIIPFRHKSNLEDLILKERLELIEVANKSLIIVKSILGNNGVNIGLNLGDRSAGGSIPEHLHMHLIPRYLGDTNFLNTSCNIGVICKDLQKLYDTLRFEFNKLSKKCSGLVCLR